MARVAVDRELLTEVLDYLETASETAKHDDSDPCHELLRRLSADSGKNMTHWGWTWQDPFGRAQISAYKGKPSGQAVENAKPSVPVYLYHFPE